MQTIGQRIRALREDKGLTIFGLSQEAGIREGTLRTWEADQRAPSDHALLKQLCDALETQTDWILYGPQSTENAEMPAL